MFALFAHAVHAETKHFRSFQHEVRVQLVNGPVFRRTWEVSFKSRLVLLDERGEDDERDHLIKAYKGLRSPGFDEWTFKGTKAGGFVGVKWARKRGIDLQHRKLEYEGERGDKALGKLVVDKNEEMATFYAVRSEVGDTKVDGQYGGSSTTLVEALRLGYLEVAKCLIDRGADVNKADHADARSVKFIEQI